MHELSICYEIIKSVEQIVVENELEKVNKITLEIGELSSIVKKYLLDCFAPAVENTMFADTIIELETIEGIAICNGCGTNFNVIKNNGYCPNCKIRDMEVISGKEFLIKSIEAY